MSGLERLLRPKSIAAIGGLQASRVVEQCQLMGFEGDIWPVHPTKTEVGGIPAFASVEDLPGSPDATFIGVNRHLTIEVVQSLRAINAGGAICYASGFLEADQTGGKLQSALIEAPPLDVGAGKTAKFWAVPSRGISQPFPGHARDIPVRS